MQDELRITLGLDLGQARNHSALAALERKWIPATASDFIASSGRAYAGHYQYTFVGMERLALGTGYPRVVEWVKDAAAQYGKQLGAIVVDATGVGSAVMDLLKRAQLGVRIVGVVVTGSGAVPGSGRTPTGYETVSRIELLTTMQVAVQTQKIQISMTRCKEWEAAVRELEWMRFEGKRAGVQDDLAFAACLAAWWGMRR